MKRWFLIGFCACSTGPTVENVDPSKAETGAKVTVFGTGFSEQTTFALEGPNGQRTVADNVKPGGAVVMTGNVPKTLATADYRIVIQHGEVSVVSESVLSVTAPPPDVPCGGDYTANTQVSWARKLVVVDRFYKDGTREVLRTPFDDIQKVEVEAIQQEKGTCSVVYIRKVDGSKMRYAESLTEDLSARAYKFANELKKPVDTKRPD